MRLPNNATLKTQEEEDELKYDAHYLLMSTISATTDSGIESLDLTELQEAVVAAVAEVQGADLNKEAVVVSRRLIHVYYSGKVKTHIHTHMRTYI